MMDCRLAGRTVLVVLSLTCVLASGRAAAPADASNPGSAANARAAAERCQARHASVDACDDAIRWNPRDSSLLVAMGDAQMRAKRPADALRAYQRAAAIAPTAAGVPQRITKAETKLAKSKGTVARGVTASAGPKRFSNADPESQSH
jgi:cytochrome c-type biogenesis protein CcmH/NrfG